MDYSETNKKIAIYDGWVEKSTNKELGENKLVKRISTDKRIKIMKVEKLNYHCSWNWLMPIVEKIEQEGYCFSVYGHQGGYTETRIFVPGIVDVAQSKISSQINDNKMEAIYKSIVDYIDWKQKKADENKH